MPKPESVLKARRTRTVNALKCKQLSSAIGFVAKTFQEMIRAEHANAAGICTCVCCGKPHPWNGGTIDAGHYITRRHTALIFDERNCAPVCVYCNRNLGGNLGQHRIYIVQAFGEEVAEYLDAPEHKRAGAKTYTRDELVELRLGFMARIDEAKERLANGLPGRDPQR